MEGPTFFEILETIACHSSTSTVRHSRIATCTGRSGTHPFVACGSSLQMSVAVAHGKGSLALCAQDTALALTLPLSLPASLPAMVLATPPFRLPSCPLKCIYLKADIPKRCKEITTHEYWVLSFKLTNQLC